MIWSLSYRADPAARVIADRHYNRQTPGAAQFVPPGRCLVLWAPGALWVTSWPLAEYVKHAWAGCWINSLFRNENGSNWGSSQRILEAVAATRWRFGLPPAGGLVTFIDPRHVRRKRDPGRCYRRAGFQHVGYTAEQRLIVLQLLPDAMPTAAAPHRTQIGLAL